MTEKVEITLECRCGGHPPNYLAQKVALALARDALVGLLRERRDGGRILVGRAVGRALTAAAAIAKIGTRP